MQSITILGATGSIGQNTLDVVARHPDSYSLFAVTANGNVNAMLEIVCRYKPQYAVMVDSGAAERLRSQLPVDAKTEVLAGEQALTEVSGCAEVDVVMAAIVGAAGLAPTLAAINQGKRVLLANKEALVVSGELFINAARNSGAQILPVDSEHNAIFQCLPDLAQQQVGHMQLTDHGIDKLLLTGSGGPFRHTPIQTLSQQTPEQACNHPNWSMGQKISVDSATMLNKGLEYIEARWLFNCQREQLDIVIHPQSVIHSMVQYIDGSVIAQMGEPDMRTPIAHVLGFPERIRSGVKGLDFMALGELSFMPVDFNRYPCLKLAIDSCWAGQSATTTLNAANEVAVAAFLQGQIRFTDIAEVCDSALQSLECIKVDSVEALMAIDSQARRAASQRVEQVVYA
ncbi:1-deoxy-D-xylulose-5-phosphate reductoisomerase [Idiomarina sp. MD25a]|uniref:1-deoxy-D-xylulose-5-phosphate reductoisomerase n=1 Tax=Idiomarina sp. MD25a TaxID=1889913 RepID=UPI0008F8773A|nr:1-deoxy-D-xylulose-5-phosphate reductoisomerase [Idiomarina sp. MD25a]OIN01625.1 1-deoxy-D-xylulose-5-phosphate reductoisomerase [Idiomarina sp. MD25a]